MSNCTSRFPPLLHAIPLLAFVVAASHAAGSTIAAIRDMHTYTLTPSSDALFAAESKTPASDAEWATLETNALALAKTSQALRSLPYYETDKRWRAFTARLANESRAAARAAKSHNVDALIAVNGNIVAACEACHDVYRDNGHGMTSDKAPAQ